MRRGASEAWIPRQFPPFLDMCRISSEVIAWNIVLGMTVEVTILSKKNSWDGFGEGKRREKGEKEAYHLLCTLLILILR
jgi:hypothetical protein